MSSKKSSSSNINNGNKNLPTKALNLFDGLINLLIDGTEQVTAVPPSDSLFHHADAISSRRCSRKDSCMNSESDIIRFSRKNAGRESSAASSSKTLGSRRSCLTSESDTVTPFRQNPCRQNAGREVLSDSTSLGSRYSSMTSESSDPSAYPLRQHAGRESLFASESFGSRRSSLTSESDTVTPFQQNADRKSSFESTSIGSRHSYMTTESSETLEYPFRQSVGRESLFASESNTSSSRMEDSEAPVSSSIPTSQRVKLITKRLAGGIEGCEVTVATKNDDGNPLIIRAVCPKFEPRRIWVNGKPFDYIDSESEHPIYDSSIEENDDIEEEEEEGEYSSSVDETSTLKSVN